MTNKQQVFNALRGEGLTLALVCGIMANIQRESNYNPKAKGDSGTSYGLCQWHKGRWELLTDFCFDRAIPEDSIPSQVKFLVWEFKKNFTTAWNSMMIEPDTAQGAYNVAYTMCVKYEIPADKHTKGKQRGTIASQLYAEFMSADTTTSNYVSYIIQKGDTLTKLASKFGVPLADILSLNPSITDPDKIKTGDVLALPEAAENNEPQAVAKADMVKRLRETIAALEDVIEWLST